MLEMMEAIRQFVIDARCLSAKMTLRESPSDIKEDNPKEVANKKIICGKPCLLFKKIKT